MATTGTPRGDTCPRCFGTITRTATEHYCGDCALVTDDAPLDRGPDWRHVDTEDGDPQRAKPGDPNRGDNGLGSRVGHASERDRDTARRARWQTRAASGSKRDRNRDYATTEVARIASALDLPDAIRARGQHVFRRLHASGACHGHDLDAVAAACLFAACREDGQGLVADDLARVARADGHTIQRRLLWVARECDLALPPPDLAQRVRVVASRLGVDAEPAVDRVRALADATTGAPSTLAACALYETTDRTQREVADAADATPTGMRAHLGVVADA